MRSRAKNLEECATLFEIEVRKETIAKAFEEVYEDITKVANIPGFRAGKAPADLVKKHYVKDAREEVLKRLIPEAYKKALEEHKVTPIGMPEISDVSFEDGKELLFRARVDTRPKFKLKDYKGIRVEKKKVEIKDDDAQKTLESLRDLNAKYVSAQDRPVRMGDYVVSDMECLVGGKSAHKKRENLWLFVDKESSIPGLAEKMVGMEKGQTREIELVLPEKYPDKSLAGKTATYRIFAKEIKERQLPAMDDEFAKDLGKANLVEVKAEIRKELEARARMSSEIDAENQLLGRLMDDNVFVVPSNLVKRQLDYMVEDSKKRLQEKGFKREELEKKDSEFREKFKNDAARQVRLMFILDEIARAENIDVTHDDLHKAYGSISVQTGKTESEVEEYYEKEGLADNLAEKLREGKVIQFLLKNASITEK